MEEGVHEALPLGTRLAEFQIEGVLGIGGFGITYRGRDETLQRPVAIKEYLPLRLARRADDGTTVAPRSNNSVQDYSLGLRRFREEARVLARFSHPSIVGVTRYIEGNDTGYLVMNFEHGESLAETLLGHRTLDEAQMLGLVCPLLDALSLIHRGGYLHRDIKPANIFLRADGSPVLIDFGAARQAVVRETTVVLTPGFAPLEQYSNRESQTPAADLYGLGATMYRCVTGGRPEAAPARLSAHYEGREDPVLRGLSSARGRYRDDVLGFIRWMLALLARDRPPSADELLTRLAPLAQYTRSRASQAITTPSERVYRRVGAQGDTTSTTSGLHTRARPTKTMHSIARPRPIQAPFSLGAIDRKRVTSALAVYIGPIARLLVDGEMRKSPRSLKELGRHLARQIPKPADACAFLADINRIARLN
ncbi:MAG: serine/threonine protein kinase [Gammaproteobacteria bacterium]|jgi:serine/threonine protein kinase